MASSSRLKPGEKGEINVSVDVRGKKGIVSKTVLVYTNDPQRPVTTLSVRMQIKDRIHMARYRAAEIFGGDCKECHSDRGRGKKGWDLFMADCFMCHNAGSNASLSRMSKMPEKHLLKVIREGVEDTVMPGFDLKNGGPLDEDQIRSLIDLIKE